MCCLITEIHLQPSSVFLKGIACHFCGDKCLHRTYWAFHECFRIIMYIHYYERLPNLQPRPPGGSLQEDGLYLIRAGGCCLVTILLYLQYMLNPLAVPSPYASSFSTHACRRPGHQAHRIKAIIIHIHLNQWAVTRVPCYLYQEMRA